MTTLFETCALVLKKIITFQLYFSATIVTMGHFIEVEQRYLTGDMTDPESESFLEPEKITHGKCFASTVLVKSLLIF